MTLGFVVDVVVVVVAVAGNIIPVAYFHRLQIIITVFFSSFFPNLILFKAFLA